MLTVNKKSAKILKDGIAHWQEEKLVDDTIAQSLLNNIEVTSFDWKRLAKYSFWISLICLIIAIGAIFADDLLIKWLENFFNAPKIILSLIFTVIAAGFYYYGIRRRVFFPEKIYSNESFLFLGVLSTAMAVYQWGLIFDNGGGHFSALFLFSFVVYAILAFWFKSRLIWVFAILSIGSWFVAETGYMSAWGASVLWMDYPLRFIVFGAILTAVALGFQSKQFFVNFANSTLVMGLLYLFIALWLTSIFGNYGDMTSWFHASKLELFWWGGLLAIVALLAIVHGLKYDNAITRGFGITFLFLNLYTKYFEYFWSGMHTAVFFAILAITLWILGVKAEKIWNFGRKKISPL
jgi:hypothetical protein